MCHDSSPISIAWEMILIHTHLWKALTRIWCNKFRDIKESGLISNKKVNTWKFLKNYKSTSYLLSDEINEIIS